MLKLSVVGLFMALAAPGLAQADVTWNAGAGVRHMIRTLDDGLDTKDAAGKDNSKQTNKRFEYRAMLGASAKSENLDWGIDMRTQPTGGVSGTASVTTEWVSNAGNQDFGIGLAQAYGRYHRNMLDTDVAVTFGRAKTVMLYDNVVQSLFDNDVRFDGFGWNFKHGMFGLNAAQYLLGAVSGGTVQASSYSRTESSDANPQTQSHFAVLYSVQPYAQFKINDDITTLLAVGWYNWSGTGGNTSAPSGTGFYTNNIHGGNQNSMALPTAVAVGNVNPVIMDNAQQWQVFSDTSLPYNLRLMGEWIMNKKTYYGTRLVAATPLVEAARTAWAATLAWGKPKKAGDIFLSYSYGSKGIASVINSFSNGDVAADNNSHFFDAKYFYADNVNFELKAQFHKEKAMLDGTGQPLAAPNNNRQTKYNRYEIVTSIAI